MEDAAVTAKTLVVLDGAVPDTNPSMEDGGRVVLPSIPLLLLLLLALQMESRSFNCCVSDFDEETSLVVDVVPVVVVVIVVVLL